MGALEKMFIPQRLKLAKIYTSYTYPYNVTVNQTNFEFNGSLFGNVKQCMKKETARSFFFLLLQVCLPSHHPGSPLWIRQRTPIM